MADTFVRDFLQFEVAETSHGKGYWLDRPWVDESQRGALLKAAVLAVPQFRDANEDPVFPDGSEAFIARLREMVGSETTLGVAIRSADYQEVALHSKAWRLPTLFVSGIAIPVILNILGNRIDALLPGHKAGDTAEITLFVEGRNHKALRLYFKGDPHDLGDLLNRSVPRFIDELDTAPAAPHQARHKAHARKPGG
jgi:hypothetical protein